MQKKNLQVRGGEVYARILGGSLCNISYFKSDTISNLQKTGVHFTNFCENPTYHKKLEARCKNSQSQFCINSENFICKITSPKIKVARISNFAGGGSSVQKSEGQIF